MELNNLSNCEQNCNKKCYIELEDGTLVRKLCKEALCRVFNNCDEIINKEIERRKISFEEFKNLRDTKIERYDDNAKTIQEIREAIPSPNENDIFEKAIYKMSFEKYIETTGRVWGFVALAKHLNNLKTVDDYINNLALDLDPNNPIYLIKFILSNPIVLLDEEIFVIPFIKPGMPDDPPLPSRCTGTGFTASENENTLPEFRFIESSEIGNGSQVFEKKLDGSEELKEIFDGNKKKFITFNGNTIIKVDNRYYKKDKDGNLTSIEIDESKLLELLPEI